MEQKEAAKHVSDNLKNIFAFSMSKLGERQNAEDLAGNIVYMIFKCSPLL